MAPSNVTVKYEDKPTDKLVEEAVQIFAGLMTADPLAIALTEGNVGYIPPMVRSLMKPIALLVGDMYTATDENGVLVGFTLFLPPGQNVLTTEEQRQMGFYEYFSLLSDAGKAYFGESMGKDFPKFIDESTGIEQTELNTYWCSFAFVRADYHGKGIAKEMFRLAFEKAKAEGYPTVALATTNIVNVTIYEKIGFEQKGYKVMPSPLVDWPAWVFVKSLQDTPA